MLTSDISSVVFVIETDESILIQLIGAIKSNSGHQSST